MFRHVSDQDILGSLAQLESAQVRSPRALRFPAAMEAQFEIDTGAARSRLLVLQGIAALLLYNSMLVLDYFALSDVFWLAVFIRVVVVGGFLTAVLAVTWRNPPVPVREGLLALAALVTAGGVLVLVVASSSPMRTNYHHGIMLIILFVIAIEKPRFRYAVPTVVGLLVLHALTVMATDTLPFHDKIAAIVLTQAMAAFALYADFSFERNERHMWLRSARDNLRARLYEELSEADPMTGLGNRRALQHWIDNASRTAPDEPVSMIIADIDHFKSYNDSFGHMQGDDCIGRVADILSEEAQRLGGRAFRFGGEEFVIVLVGYGPHKTYDAAEAMRQAILRSRQPRRTETGTDIVTCSFGWACDALEDGFEVAALITEADYALYAAKRAGRNQVMPAPEVASDSVSWRNAV